jgi:hypothetical protein
MIDAARAYLEPDFGGRVEFMCSDRTCHSTGSSMASLAPHRSTG